MMGPSGCAGGLTGLSGVRGSLSWRRWRSPEGQLQRSPASASTTSTWTTQPSYSLVLRLEWRSWTTGVRGQHAAMCGTTLRLRPAFPCACPCARRSSGRSRRFPAICGDCCAPPASTASRRSRPTRFGSPQRVESFTIMGSSLRPDSWDGRRLIGPQERSITTGDTLMADRRCAIPVGGQAMAGWHRRCVGAASVEARGRKGLPSGVHRGSVPVLDQLSGGRS